MVDDKNQEFQILLERYIARDCSEDEKEIVESWYYSLNINSSKLNEKELISELIELEGRLDKIAPDKETVFWSPDRKTFSFAASLFVIAIVSLLYFWPKEHSSSSSELMDSYLSEKKPGENKAVLILEDGSRVLLDTIGSLAEFQSRILSNNEHITSDQSIFHTIETPKGGQFQFVLPDKSKVWLNAESSITFPLSFSTKNRSVDITGEVYFDVQHEDQRKFIVHTDELAIEVFGTEFNVKAYPESPYLEATLIDGSIQLAYRNENIMLEPNFQATVNKISNQLPEPKAVNAKQIASWKEGWFSFDKTPLSEVVSQIARWYDLEYEIDAAMRNRKFSGGIERNNSLQEVLNILEVSGVCFHIEKDILIISPKK